ncbi:protein phosphatase 2C domain-containing protein [Roseibacterium sp. SDUM158017]|uniref:PP2C family protein-serine/threonine phosphatase n=1 Tax=Roseicyclus salinarum TaxID=3036773 RepID=UPI00241582D3|nr:protein phosphatase 2C domain-containing protein [Roseibacterium sp. SDUM158017]MDG4647768.1 protein phosphatase 2C domain-containing protein [Roseibacterium sp. SDUM158017]
MTELLRTPPVQASAALRYDVASAQCRGDRERQEDALAVSCPDGADFGFAVVSDGMGGHAAGDLASRIIVAEIFAELILRGRGPLGEAAELSALLNDAVHTANASLRAQIDACPEQAGMGGTVVATALVDGGLQWVSVGDSVLYLLREGRIERLNDDHSMAPEIDLMAARGMIDAEAARTHPQRNFLTSALTGQDIPEVDCPVGRFDLRDGDILLIASDGLQTLSDARIAEIVGERARDESRAIAVALIDAVTACGQPEQDNTSVVVLKVEAPDAAPAPGAQPVEDAKQSAWSALAMAFRRPPMPAEASAKSRG